MIQYWGHPLVAHPAGAGLGVRHVPDAPVFPDDSAGARRGGQDRRLHAVRGVLAFFLPLSKPALAMLGIYICNGYGTIFTTRSFSSIRECR